MEFGGVSHHRVGLHVHHVNFILFVYFFLASGSQSKHDFWWDMGFKCQSDEASDCGFIKIKLKFGRLDIMFRGYIKHCAKYRHLYKDFPAKKCQFFWKCLIQVALNSPLLNLNGPLSKNFKLLEVHSREVKVLTIK